MEIVTHQNQPYEDIVRPITETDRQNPEFAQAEARVEALFREVGAVVVGGVSYSGERPVVSLFIHAERSEAMANFSNRPA
jgi:hypothetical protein